MYGYRKMYINGELVDAANNAKRDVICPATDEKVAEVAWAGTQDTLKALEAAKKAFPVWSSLAVQERSKYMLALREAIVENEELIREMEMYESGKTYPETNGGYTSIIDSLEYYAHEIKRLHGFSLVDPQGTHKHEIIYQAAGVAGVFVAWNFPLLNFAWKLGPALATGCPIVFRPSSETPLTGYFIGELCHKIGLPAGAYNVLAGPVKETADVITSSKIPAILTLTGSIDTGIEIMKNGATSIKKYSMELGGNAPVLVFDDADINLASSVVSNLKFNATGQICVSPNRVFVHESIYDEFVSKVVENAKARKVGHGRNSDATMGPLINKKSRDRVMVLVDEAIKDGAVLEYGGKIPEGFEEKGSFLMPTVLSNVKDEMKICKQEVFGPVVSILRFKDYNDVIKRANDTDTGLASYVFSTNLTTTMRASNDLEFGEVQVNGVKYHVEFPHMGIKQSGIGQDCSFLALEDYTVKKRITTAKI